MNSDNLIQSEVDFLLKQNGLLYEQMGQSEKHLMLMEKEYKGLVAEKEVLLTINLSTAKESMGSRNLEVSTKETLIALKVWNFLSRLGLLVESIK